MPEATPYPLTCALVGLKGFEYLRNIIKLGAIPSRVVGYEQSDDTLRSLDKIKALCDAQNIPFELNKRPLFGKDETVFLVGWQFLVYDRPEHMIVFHDSLLPKYRGFAPTVTALINGEPKIGVSAIVPADGVDTGNIVEQFAFDVTYPIKVEDALRLQAEGMARLTLTILKKKHAGELSIEAQDHSSATFSIWRDSDDYWIDWSEPADRIVRTIDAVGPPYAGARSIYRGTPIIIREAIVSPELRFEIRQPGKIWSIEKNTPMVICGSGLIKILDAETESGEPVKFERLRNRLVNPSKVL